MGGRDADTGRGRPGRGLTIEYFEGFFFSIWEARDIWSRCADLKLADFGGKFISFAAQDFFVSLDIDFCCSDVAVA